MASSQRLDTITGKTGRERERGRKRATEFASSSRDPETRTTGGEGEGSCSFSPVNIYSEHHSAFSLHYMVLSFLDILVTVRISRNRVLRYNFWTMNSYLTIRQTKFYKVKRRREVWISRFTE